MISSEDVRRVTFDRAMRGYRCEDVDDYLKQVADSMDALSASNEELQKKLVVLAQRIEQYRAEEDTLRTTMLNAQRLGENVIREAKQKAADIIRTANMKAEDREQRAREEVELSRQELITLKREADTFKKSLLEMYRKHIKLLSKIPEYHPEDDAPAALAAPSEDILPQPESAPAPATAYPQQEYAAPTAYYEEPQPAPAQEQAAEEEKVDTVEFAIAPTPEEPAASSPAADPDALEQPFQPGAGLYDSAEDDASPSKKPARKKSRAKAKPQPDVQDDLPAAFDSFESVDL